jgi:hypothetical protein
MGRRELMLVVLVRVTNRAVCSFFAWLEQHGIGGLVDIESFHVAAQCL